ncbi:MAG: class I SAM-dependent methyltransferase [Rhodobacteraceae bacterium]|nr:class I SAM-dependent methyltransferase [Paracoccaceae bacterium]
MNDNSGLSTPGSIDAEEIEVRSGPRTAFEPGSFRDRNSRVFYRGDRVYRSLSPTALANWRRLQDSAVLAKRQRLGQIVGTREAEALEGTVSAGVLEHDRIPFVSYPYEWCFGMLKDAALLHLDLMRDALDEDMILKDASPYNIQWNGSRPVFIDIPSFEPLRPGAAWVGYRQFCELFLYPLMLHAYKGADYRPWLRGRIDGIPADEMRRLMSWRDVARPGVLMHVSAQAALQRRYSGNGRNVRGALANAGFKKSLIVNNVNKLYRLIEKLTPVQERTEWSDYASTHSYDSAEAGRKAEFVREAAASQRWKLGWDLGCNTGDYSRLLAEHCDCVVAMDGDPQAIEALFQREKTNAGRILPLVINFGDASPNQGWLGTERKGLAERGRPELTLCLALVHHIVITANIPLLQFIGWLADLGTSVVIEFVGRDDEMVQVLLQNREDQYQDYHEEAFRSILVSRFDICNEQVLKGGRRKIFFAKPRLCERPKLVPSVFDPDRGAIEQVRFALFSNDVAAG